MITNMKASNAVLTCNICTLYPETPVYDRDHMFPAPTLFEIYTNGDAIDIYMHYYGYYIIIIIYRLDNAYEIIMKIIIKLNKNR